MVRVQVRGLGSGSTNEVRDRVLLKARLGLG